MMHTSRIWANSSNNTGNERRIPCRSSSRRNRPQSINATTQEKT